MKHKANNGLAGARRYPRNWKWGVLFICPWIIGFLTLQLYPLLQSLFFSFTDFSILSDGKWIGIKNYVDLFWKILFADCEVCADDSTHEAGVRFVYRHAFEHED